MAYEDLLMPWERGSEVMAFKRNRFKAPWLLPWVTEYWDGANGVTVTGSGVSAWVGMKLGATFSQGTDAERPTYANGEVTTDGAARWIQTGAMTLGIPLTLVMAIKQPTWVSQAVLVDGRAANATAAFYQYSATPNLQAYNGSSPVAGEPNSSSDLAVNTWAVVSVGWSTTAGAAFIKVNRGAKRTGVNTSATAPNGLTLGRLAASAGQFGNGSWRAIAAINGTLTDAQLEQTIIAVGRRTGISV